MATAVEPLLIGIAAVGVGDRVVRRAAAAQHAGVAGDLGRHLDERAGVGATGRVLRAQLDHRHRRRPCSCSCSASGGGRSGSAGWRGRVPAAIAVFAVIAAGGFGISARGPASTCSAGEDQAEQGIDLLNDGEFALAAERFEAAAASLRRAEERLGSPWVAAAVGRPGRRPAPRPRGRRERSRLGGDGAHRRRAAPDRSGPAAGRGRARSTCRRWRRSPSRSPRSTRRSTILAGAVDGARSPWLVAEAGDRARLARRPHRRARPALGQRPHRRGPRPAHARRRRRTHVPRAVHDAGRGPWARWVRRQLRRADHRRGSHRDDRVRTGQRSRTAGRGDRRPRQRARRSSSPTTASSASHGDVGDAAFRNLTMTPNFPFVGEVASELYAQITGTSVDGVIAIDPFVLQALLRYTDGIQLTSVPYAPDGRQRHRLPAAGSVRARGGQPDAHRRPRGGRRADVHAAARRRHAARPDRPRSRPRAAGRALAGCWCGRRTPTNRTCSDESACSARSRHTTAPTAGRSPSTTRAATRSTASSSAGPPTSRAPTRRPGRRPARCASS